MNQTRQSALFLVLLMFLLVALAAFIFSYQAQGTLAERNRSLAAAVDATAQEGTRTGEALVAADGTRAATEALLSTAEADSLALEGQLVERQQELETLNQTLAGIQTALDDANAALAEVDQQPPLVRLVAPLESDQLAARAPIPFLIAASDRAGLSRLDLTVDETTVSEPLDGARLLTRSVTRTLDLPGEYTVAITAVNLNQLSTTITATFQVITPQVALRSSVTAQAAAMWAEAPPAPPDPFVLIPRPALDAWLAETVLPPEARQELNRVWRAFGLIDEPVEADNWVAELAATRFAFLYYDVAADRFYTVTAGMLADPLLELALLPSTGAGVVTPTVTTTPAEGADGRLAARAAQTGESVLLQTLYLARNEAVAAEVAAWRNGLLAAGAPLITGMPAPLRQRFLFPYVQGYRYLAALYADGGVDAVAAAVAEPPTSTAQVLGHQAPGLPVTLPDLAPLLGPTWQQVDSDTGGAFRLQQVLAPALPAAQVTTAVAGWRGDTYAAFVRPADEAVALAWRLARPSAAEAIQVGGLLGDYASARTQDDAPLELGGGTCWQGDAVVCVLARGSAVHLVTAPDLSTASALVTALP